MVGGTALDGPHKPASVTFDSLLYRGTSACAYEQNALPKTMEINTPRPRGGNAFCDRQDEASSTGGGSHLVSD